MKSRFGWRQKLRYHFDNYMARGTRAQLTGLTVSTVVLVFILSGLLFTLQIGPKVGNQTLIGIMWDTFTGVLRPKPPNWMPDQLGYMVIRLVVLVLGMFVVSLLIGILTSGFHTLVMSLGEGRSLVPVKNHTLILGWTPALPSILRELGIANESERRAHIVVLADRDVMEMEDEIRKAVPNPGRTRFISRRGDAFKAEDLAMVNIDGARSVIILPPEEEEEPDIEVIKILMAVVNNPLRTQASYHLVTSIRDQKNIDVAYLASKGEVELIPSLEVISKLTAQTCRQAGLPVVYTEIMSFEGNEMYFSQEPQLVGKEFGEALFSYSASVVMGLIRAQGDLLLNPPSNTQIMPGDQLLLLAEDDSTIVYDEPRFAVDVSMICDGHVKPVDSERIVIIGWNAGTALILLELDKYVKKGSEARILVHNEEFLKRVEELRLHMQNLWLDVYVGDTCSRRELNALKIESCDHVIILRFDRLPPSKSDAKVLVTLLHVRDILDRSGKDIAVVSELIVEQNSQLARESRADDFVVGEHLIGLLYSQISENKELNRIFDDLLSEEGSEIYLKPAEVYVRLGVPIDFYTVTESARRKGEIALGFRRIQEQSEPSKNYGVVLNPNKNDKVVYGQGDLIIVLAEDYHH